MTCTVSRCDRKTIARGLCGRHYQRFHKYGNTQGNGDYGTPGWRRTITLAQWSRSWDHSRSKWARTEKPTSLDIAWAAGIYEGEGSIYGGLTGQFVCRITQKDRELLYHLQKLFGGEIHLHGQKMLRGYRASEWAIRGVRAHGFLMTIYGFLTARRQRQLRCAMNKSMFRRVAGVREPLPE